MENQFKREPSIEKNIQDLTKEDSRIAVAGLIVSKNGNTFLLDDGTGQIAVSLDQPLELDGYIRVFGRLMPYENGMEIQGEFIQDLNNIDKSIHKKLKEAINKK